MSIEEQPSVAPEPVAESTAPEMVIPLTPKIRPFEKVPRIVDPETGKPESWAMSRMRHRLVAVASEEVIAENPDIYTDTDTDTRRGVYRRTPGEDTARLQPQIRGSQNRQAYQVPTREAGQHVRAMFFRDKKALYLAVNRRPEAGPLPEEIAVPPSEKRSFRHLLSPRRQGTT